MKAYIAIILFLNLLSIQLSLTKKSKTIFHFLVAIILTASVVLAIIFLWKI
jgi:hypothetical protein